MTLSLYSRLEIALGDLMALQAYETDVARTGFDYFGIRSSAGRLRLTDQHQQAVHSLGALEDHLAASVMRAARFTPEEALKLRRDLEQTLAMIRPKYAQEMDLLHRIVRGEPFRANFELSTIPDWALPLHFVSLSTADTSAILAEGRRIAQGVERILGGRMPHLVSLRMNPEGVTTLGSGHKSDFIVADPQAVEVQASLGFKYRRHWIRDEWSHRTYVDSVRIPPGVWWPLGRSQEIRLSKDGETACLELPTPPPLEEGVLVGEFLALRDQELPGFDEDLAFTVFESLTQAIQGVNTPAALASVLATSPLVHGALWAGALRRKLPDLPRVFGIQTRMVAFQDSGTTLGKKRR